MSSSPVVGTREVAYRLFAVEFDDASLSYSESDEERAPNFVVSPTGARLNRTFVAGVLTEVERVNDEVLRGRIADPTGAFVTYAGQYQPEPMAFLDGTTPPAFVSLAGKARTYEPDDADVVYTSVRPESINTVDADVRDRWVVSAAEATLRRIAVFDEALSMPYRGDDLTRALEARGVDSTLAAGIPRAIEHYGTTRTYLEALRELAVQALELVAGDRDQVDPLSVAPDEGGDAVLGSLPAPDLEPVESIDVTATETESEADGSAETGELTASADSADSDGPEAVAETDDASESKSEPRTADSAPEATAESTDALGDDVATESQTAAAGAEADADTAAESKIEAASNSEPELASEPEPAPESVSGSEPAVESESELESKPEPESESEPESSSDSSGTLGDFGDDPAEHDSLDATDGELGDFEDDFGDIDSSESEDTSADTEAGDSDADSASSTDPNGMYELGDDERAEIESEFGTEFTSGTDVDPAGEADIDVPDANELSEQLEDEPVSKSEAEAEPASEPVSTTPSEPASGSEAAADQDAAPAPESGATSDTATDETADDGDGDDDTAAEDIDLESVVVDTMETLDDGDGAAHDDVLAVVVDEHGADPGAVEDAIQEALLGGRCYEPQDGVLKAI
ncbi:hypothetical protein C440_12949 [Haloferax mucosum ATCC BAA-1512]|uniref:Rpa-associated protein n=1 Tax=Haloferax mucosum ATCC BAA-1512 TaxID=662479 RepID=M0I5H2_9EURY|nr:hypothetical protein [Haloferax mucosum]ELZ91222.1 hypothetical protein C440_12949 [Haloferax mucosum ATCC BAA-1512]